MYLKIGALCSDCVAVAATAIQIDMAGLENIFSIICLVLTSISITLGLVIRLIQAIKKAKADGKITADEVKEIVEIGKEGVDELIENVQSNLDKTNEK